MNDSIELLVLGLGNVLLSDDGLGTVAIHRLAGGYQVPDRVQVVDGGTHGIRLLPFIEDAERAILIGAVSGGLAAGTLVEIEGPGVLGMLARRALPHQAAASELLEAALVHQRLPQRIALVGLVPESIRTGFGRSPAVERRLPELLARVVELSRQWGFVFQPSGGVEAGRAGVANRYGPHVAGL